MKIENSSKPKYILTVALAIFVVTVGYSCFAGQATVVDVMGKPIAGLQVVTFWSARRPQIAEGQGWLCFGLTAMTSDENGRFDVPVFSWSFNPLAVERRLNINLAASGFVQSNKSNRDNLKFVLEPLPDPKTDRYVVDGVFKEVGDIFQQLSGVALDSRCGDPKIARPYYEVAIDNLKLLARSKEDWEKISSELYQIDYFEFGSEYAAKKNLTRGSDPQWKQLRKQNEK